MAQNVSQTKTERLVARTTPDIHKALKHAAEIEGRSVSDFVVQAAAEAARETIARTQIIALSAEDQSAFAAALLDPPAPTDAARRSAARHAQLVREL